MLACRTGLAGTFHHLLLLIALLQGEMTTLASPTLSERGNSLRLKCTNAPNVIAGYYLDPADAIPPNNFSATCQNEFEYLYCVPGTSTYLFFGTLKSTLQPASAYATALNGSIHYILNIIGSSGDGPITDGSQYIITDPTHVLIYGEDANKHHLTWGVFGAALTGLNAWMQEAENGYSDATVQINDGKNWVGNAYVGAQNEEQDCVFEGAYVPNTTCEATDENGYIYGPKGGKIC